MQNHAALCIVVFFVYFSINFLTLLNPKKGNKMNINRRVEFFLSCGNKFADGESSSRSMLRNVKWLQFVSHSNYITEILVDANLPKLFVISLHSSTWKILNVITVPVISNCYRANVLPICQQLLHTSIWPWCLVWSVMTFSALADWSPKLTKYTMHIFCW